MRFNKKFFGVVLLTLALIVGIGSIGSIARAEEDYFGLKVKQGALYSWESKEVDNLTTFELLRTKPVEGWGMWKDRKSVV